MKRKEGISCRLPLRASPNVLTSLRKGYFWELSPIMEKRMIIASFFNTLYCWHSLNFRVKISDTLNAHTYSTTLWLNITLHENGGLLLEMQNGWPRVNVFSTQLFRCLFKLNGGWGRKPRIHEYCNVTIEFYFSQIMNGGGGEKTLDLWKRKIF